MDDTRQKSKGLIVTVVILIILLLGLGGYMAYDKLIIQKDNEEELVKLNNDLKEANEKVAELEQEKEKYSSNEEKNYMTTNSFGSGKSINIYSYGLAHVIYSYEGKMYIAAFDLSEDTEERGTVYDIIYAENPAESNQKFKTKDLKIEEEKVVRVITTNNFYTSDAQQFIYIIFKDGSVKRYNFMGKTNIEGETVLKDYKVKDLEVSCKGGWENCKSLTYELTLQDGSTKTVTEK